MVHLEVGFHVGLVGRIGVVSVPVSGQWHRWALCTYFGAHYAHPTSRGSGLPLDPSRGGPWPESHSQVLCHQVAVGLMGASALTQLHGRWISFTTVGMAMGCG